MRVYERVKWADARNVDFPRNILKSLEGSRGRLELPGRAREAFRAFLHCSRVQVVCCGGVVCGGVVNGGAIHGPARAVRAVFLPRAALVAVGGYGHKVLISLRVCFPFSVPTSYRS